MSSNVVRTRFQKTGVGPSREPCNRDICTFVNVLALVNRSEDVLAFS